jgi:hypothetical protein
MRFETPNDIFTWAAYNKQMIALRDCRQSLANAQAGQSVDQRLYDTGLACSSKGINTVGMAHTVADLVKALDMLIMFYKKSEEI